MHQAWINKHAPPSPSHTAFAVVFAVVFAVFVFRRVSPFSLLPVALATVVLAFDAVRRDPLVHLATASLAGLYVLAGLAISPVRTL